MKKNTLPLFVFCILAFASNLLAEDGYNLWLRYAKTENADLRSHYQKAISSIVVAGESETANAIRQELKRAIPAILDHTPLISSKISDGNGLIVGNFEELKQQGLTFPKNTKEQLDRDGFVIMSTTSGKNQANQILIGGNTDVAALYGTFHFIRLLQTNQTIESLNIVSSPKTKRRMLNHWDKIDGHIERGYAGKSLWKWEDLPGKIETRYIDYARACASVGINGVVLTNVNAEAEVLSTEYIYKWAALANVFRPYGVKVYISTRWDSPMLLDGVETADPRNTEVKKWWKDKANEIYKHVPDFGGFLVKANSEGQPGPLTYKATHAVGANMLGDALAPHGGIVMWRAFVYDFAIGEDRANSAFDEFKPLDGEFLPNVCVQVKNGPIDFQPREPFSPLFGGVPDTNLALELQITQEYLGHSKHWVYLAPMWSEVLNAETYAKGSSSTIGERVGLDSLSVIAGVANTGDDRNWCGHHGAQANWYAFGRLSWNYTLSPEKIADEWIRATWSNDSNVVETIRDIMIPSWETCINYMTPLGLQHLVQSGEHYGPEPGQNRAGRPFWKNVYYHRADNEGLGINRSSSGSNGTGQYNEPLSERYDDLTTCPEKYLLWFHHVPWNHKMQSGRTLSEELQYRYRKGAADCEAMSVSWDGLQGNIDQQRHAEVAERLEEQVRSAKEWRDTCISYFKPFAEGKAKNPAFQK